MIFLFNIKLVEAIGCIDNVLISDLIQTNLSVSMIYYE